MDLTRLTSSIERQLGLLGYELVCLEQDGGRTNPVIRLFIDHLDARSVTLDDCAEATEGIVAWMDVEFPKMREEVSLEVSSPGIERPLVKPDHFTRFLGRLCRIQTARPLNGQKRFKGWINAVTGNAVTLEEDGLLKTVPFESIQKARLAPFDESGTPAPKLLAEPESQPTESVRPDHSTDKASGTPQPEPFPQA